MATASLVREIVLTQGKVAIVEAEDFDRLNALKWQAKNSQRTGKDNRPAWYATHGRMENQDTMDAPGNYWSDSGAACRPH